MDWNNIFGLVGVIEKLTTLFPNRYTAIVAAAAAELDQIHSGLAGAAAAPTAEAIPSTPATSVAAPDGILGPSVHPSTIRRL